MTNGLGNVKLHLVDSVEKAHEFISWLGEKRPHNAIAIDTETGAVTFIALDPDFESPADVGGDNVYTIDIVATDEGGLSDTQTVNIDVTNVNETIPSLGSGLTAGFNENDTGIVYDVTGATQYEVKSVRIFVARVSETP